MSDSNLTFKLVDKNVTTKDQSNEFYPDIFELFGNDSYVLDKAFFPEYIEYGYQYPDHPEKVVFCALLFAFSLILNIALLVQQILKVQRGTQESTYKSQSMPFMLINLAIVNLMTSFFTILVYDIQISIILWYAGTFMCKLWAYFTTLAMFLKLFSVVALLMAYIAERATGKDGKTVALYFLLPGWILALILSIPQALLNNTMESEEDRIHCADYFPISMRVLANIYLVVACTICVLSFIISAVLSCCYCIVGRKDKPISAVDQIHIAVSYNASSEMCTSDTIPLDDERDNIMAANYTPLTIAIVCFLLWIPVFSMFCISYEFLGFSDTLWNVYLWLLILSYCSVIVTPLIALIGTWSYFDTKAITCNRFSTS